MTCPGSHRALGVANPQPRSPHYAELLHNSGKLLQTPNMPKQKQKQKTLTGLKHRQPFIFL